MIRAGLGRDHNDIADRLTWRQVRLYSAALQRANDAAQADRIEAAALGMGGDDIPGIIDNLRGIHGEQ